MHSCLHARPSVFVHMSLARRDLRESCFPTGALTQQTLSDILYPFPWPSVRGTPGPRLEMSCQCTSKDHRPSKAPRPEVVHVFRFLVELDVVGSHFSAREVEYLAR